MKISIVTPNLNHGHYLAQTLDSVLRNYGVDLEYCVVDGGSSDGSEKILEGYVSRLSSCIIERDDGLYSAINKGFSRTDGDIMGWINSGDVLFPDALSLVSEVFETFPHVHWITSSVLSFLDERGRLIEQVTHPGVTRKSYLKGFHLPEFNGRALTHSMIQQESTFWRRSLWMQAGGLNTSYRFAADFALWSRFFEYEELFSVPAPLGAFRRHHGQLSQSFWSSYLAEATSVLRSNPSFKNTNGLCQSVAVGLKKIAPPRLRRQPWARPFLDIAPTCVFSPDDGAWHLER